MPALTGRISTPRTSYSIVLRTPGAWKFFLAAAPARIGIAMTGLGIVWLVHGSTGSYAVAGTVTGGFAVAEALAGPQVARLIDRYGQTRMLPVTLLFHAAAVALLIALTTTQHPQVMLVLAGVLAGASLPQVGAQTSARWVHALRGRPELSTAFALEALSTGVAFLVGPVLIGTVSALGSPMAGSILAASLLVAGGLSLAVQRSTAPPLAQRNRLESSARLLRRGFLVLIATNIGIGLFFGSMQVSVTAFAVDSGSPSLAGPLYAVTSLVSLFAGFAYGARTWRMPPPRQFVLVLTALTLSTIPLLVASSPLTLALALALPGLAIAPFQTLSAVLTESEVAPSVLTQAFTWLNSGSAAGVALGAALAGRVVDAHSPHYGFALALLATLVATVVALTRQR
ncbi:major facilitator superfamily MFS_1 [Kribbella flavida DSM 17836]|uniref:Major facilitator superfamily MFS_1 n=1 Tax=Kribbella flavida (strain DSM 17836 / JCM 10339 / NBRC 14399) TaxID=479435 RepID=D2Q103_KRIFD|nr:MFS transporter [Kribbella flavida]ADB35704.1 major facilitator superfamily MFS_1 [Kribbella flavida DSM 17836]